MKNILILCTLSLIVGLAFADNREQSNTFWTSCQISDKQAYGYIHSNHAFSFSGKGKIEIYSASGLLLEQKPVHAISVLSQAGKDLVEQKRVSGAASHCYLKIVGATKATSVVEQLASERKKNLRSKQTELYSALLDCKTQECIHHALHQ